ncbi:MAG: TetR family transcriptional regulator [Clostridia bacterium]|jgi:AcrR family transcriptional regulator|nr:TetR family transcriptional regulator [Clostridia bacterium]
MEKTLMDAASTRDKILHATLKIIGKEGFQSITIKKIADLAEVNIAAVNYYFGSKTNVINEAIQVLNRKRMRCFEVLEQKDIPPVERLRRFLFDYMESAFEYPDVFRSVIYCAINNCLDSGDNIVLLKTDSFEKIKNTINEAGLYIDNEVLMMKLVQIIGCIQLPILLGEQMEHMSGINFNENENINKYVEIMLKSLLNP